MPRLIPLPDRHGPTGAARLWFNPDHIVTLAPKIHDTGGGHTLSVELKLTGVPAMDAWLGDHSTTGAADAAWQTFLDQITGPALDG
jgi:hypothetical protein